MVNTVSVTWSGGKIGEYLFYLFIFFLPWQTRWIVWDPALNGGVWEYGRVSLYGWDIILILLLLLSWPGVVGVVKDWQRVVPQLKNQKSEIKMFFSPLVIFLLLVALGFCSTLWAPSSVLVLYWGLRLLEAGALWLLFRALQPKLELVWLSLAASGVVQGLWGSWQFLSQNTFSNKWLGVAEHSLAQPGTSVVLTSAGRWLRAYGGQVHPNVLGGLLVITSLATVWLYLGRKGSLAKPYQSYLLLAGLVVQTAGLFFSFSRGAWLALLLALAVWWLLHQQHRRALCLPVVVTLATLVFLGYQFWEPTVGRLFGSGQLEQQSLDDRVGEVGESTTLLHTVWWRGVGLGNYTAALYDAQPKLSSYLYQPVHNLFALVLTELGVAGLGLLLWLLWLYVSGPSLRYDLVFLVPVLTVALLDHYWWTSASMLLLGVVALSLPPPQPPPPPTA